MGDISCPKVPRQGPNSLFLNPFLFPPCLNYLTHSLMYTQAMQIITFRWEWIYLYSHGKLGLKMGRDGGPVSTLSLAGGKNNQGGNT